MKVLIDFSVSTAAGYALAQVGGEIDCPVEPMMGDTISLVFAPNGTGIPAGHNLGGQLKVVDRIILLNGSERSFCVVLEDLVVSEKEQAIDIFRYLENGFGFMVHSYA